MIIKALCPHVDCCPGVWHHVQLINPRDLAVTIVTVAMAIEKDDLQLVAPTLSCFRDD